MDPILKIIEYLFKKHGFKNAYDTFDSFFNDGTAFPYLIDTIFSESIPGIIQNPTDIHQITSNNNIALNFLFTKNQDIAKVSPSYETEEEKIHLLTLILTKQCFKVNEKKIIDECNLIVQQLQINFKSLSDLQNINCIFYILKVLTKGEVRGNIKTKSINQILKYISSKTTIPLVISQISNEPQRRFTFLIQILIIFDFFSEDIKQLKNYYKIFNIQEKKQKNEDLSDQDLNFDIFNKAIKPNQRKFWTLNDDHQNDIENNEEEDNDDDENNDDFLKNTIAQDIDDTEEEDEKEENNDDENGNEQDQVKLDKSLIFARKDEQSDSIEIEKEETNEEKKQDKEGIEQKENEEDEEEEDENDEMQEKEEGNDDVEVDGAVNNDDVDEMLNMTFKPITSFDELDDKKEKLMENAILKTISNFTSEKCKFDDIVSATEITNILSVLNYVIANKTGLNILKNNIKKANNYSQKIDHILTFLCKINPIFKVLRLTLNENEIEKKSAILFYTKILDSCFLKKSKQELLDRCLTLLFTEIKKEDTLYEISTKIKSNPKEILLNWDTYLALVYFVNYSKIHFKKEKLKPENYSFEMNQIPQIIDENYLNQIDIDFSPLCYQLQFIFNELDKQDFVHYFIESYLISIKKLNQISIPDSINLAISMIPKKVAFSDQKINKKNELNENLDSQKQQEQEQEQEIMKTPPKLSTFEDRQLIMSIKLKKTNCDDQDENEKLPSAQEYWTIKKSSYNYDNGIFIYKKNVNIEVWNNCIKNRKESKSKDLINVKEMIPKKKFLTKRHQLFKFFIYDENEMIWKKNSESISLFIKKMKIDETKNNTTLVLLSNSYEKDLIKFSSNLIQFQHPEFDQQIFVYALYGKEFNNEFNIIKNPIFLLLHIPEEKQKLENINTIVFQIYYFLSIICDIEIVILNKECFVDQINIIEKFMKIKNSYKEQNDNKEKETEILVNSSVLDKPEKNFSDVSSDGDDNKSDDDDEDDDFVNDVFSTIKSNIFEKPQKFIVLVNSEEIKGDKKFIDQKAFFENIRSHVSGHNCHVDFINIDDVSTYNSFLQSFHHLIFTIQNENDETFEKLDFYQMSHVSGFYLLRVNTPKYESILKNKIENRYNQYKKFDKEKQKTSFELLNDVINELVSTYPSIDENYGSICKSIIELIKLERIERNKSIINEQLALSAESSVNYWSFIIKTKFYWSKEDRLNLIVHHENFLKSEFFKILDSLYTKYDLPYVFEGNYSILSKQIKNDISEFENEFEMFDNEINKFKSNQKVESFDDKKNKGTNYMIREKENIRETKIIVEKKEFDSIFDSDF